ncbi:MAG: CHAT domain-containing protein [Bacteroidota bacterium]
MPIITKQSIKENLPRKNIVQSVNELVELARVHDSGLYNETLLLASRANSLQSDILHGLINASDANVTRNQISYALLSYLEKFDPSWQVEMESPMEAPLLQASTNQSIQILFLGVNPIDGPDNRRIDEEARDIENGLRQSRNRDLISMKTKWAITRTELRRALLNEPCNIVHFAGFGRQGEGLVLEDASGVTTSVSPSALADLFRLFANQIQCVILNACFVQEQAWAIAAHIDYVIGMPSKLPKEAAIEFATAFYDSLGAGRDIDFAFSFAVSSMQLQKEHKIVQPLLFKKGAN